MTKTQVNIVSIANSLNLSKFELLGRALEQSGFWKHINQARLKHKSQKFSILIKVDLEFYNLKQNTATDPELVEHLVDLLYENKFEDIKIGDSCDTSIVWLENREVYVLAELLNYQYTTQKSNDYEIVDLSEDLVDANLSESSVLRNSKISNAVKNSDYIILFSKNKTEGEDRFSLGMHNLIKLLPQRNKRYHYYQHSRIQEVAEEVFNNYKADFSIIDAYISNHGNTASYANNRIKTNTVIASADMLKADSVSAFKMRLKLKDSRLYQNLSDAHLSHSNSPIIGDLSFYENWKNVDEIISTVSKYRRQSFFLENLLEPVLYEIDYELFPFKEALQQKLNEMIAPLYLDNTTTGYGIVVALSTLIGYLTTIVSHVNIQVNKNGIWRKKPPLNIDKDSLKLTVFREIESYLDSLYSEYHEKIKKNKVGLSWNYHQDDSIVFQYSRKIGINFDDFVDKVDISKSIQYMNDYIGGLIVPIKQNINKQNTYQIERNLYLPQPNYLAFSGGDNIDVTKLEYIKYLKNEHKIVWRTVYSENDSADYDDGWVSFKRTSNNHVEINIFGRQLFTLPASFQFFNIDNYPALKNILVENSYQTFFSNTVANFEAIYQGRDVQIGKPPIDDMDQPYCQNSLNFPSQDDFVSMLDKFEEYVDLKKLSQINLSTLFFDQQKPQPNYIDHDGFSHFNTNLITSVEDMGNHFKVNDFLTSKFQSLIQNTCDDIQEALKKDYEYQFNQGKRQ